MNVSNLDSQNTEKLRERLQLGPSYIPRLASNNNNLPVQRSASMPTEPRRSSSESASKGMKMLPQSPRARVTASEGQGSQSLISKSNTVHLPHIPSDTEDGPPPTPPKESREESPMSAFVKSASTGSTFGTTRQRVGSYMSDGDEVVISPGSLGERRSYMSFMSSRAPPRVVSPTEKAKHRLEAQKRREAEELQVQREEAERQARLKREKEEALRQAEAEEERRRARLEEEKRQALAERARREREAQLEEEHRLQELETRKRQEKERRILQAKRLEEERQEAERRATEVAKKREEQRRVSDVTRKKRMKEIQKQFTEAGQPLLLTGYVTMQTSVSNTWKRRFFELKKGTLVFYRDSQVSFSPSPTTFVLKITHSCNWFPGPHDGVGSHGPF